MPGSYEFAASPSQRISVLVLGIEDTVGVRTAQRLDSAGHRTSAGFVDQRSRQAIGPNVRIVELADLHHLRQQIGCHDVVAVLALLVADPCSAAAHVLSRASRTRRAKYLTLLSEALASTRGPRPRLIVRSTTALYADHGDGWISESSELEICRATRLAGSAERLAAAHARQGGVSVVLRMASTYGPGDRRTDQMLRLAARGWEPFGGPDPAYVPLLHLEDATSAISHALDARPGIYNVSDGHPATNRDLNDSFAAAVGRTRLHPLWPSIRSADRERLTRSHRVDASRFECATGWHATAAPHISCGIAGDAAAGTDKHAVVARSSCPPPTPMPSPQKHMGRSTPTEETTTR